MDRDWIALTEEPLDFAAVHAHLSCPEAGGRVVFSGHVRPTEDGAPIDALDYEHYPPMALRQMEALARELHAQWPIERLALVHRVGRVSVGETAVIVGVACGHRAEAFAAARHAIDRLKERVPIWKS